MRKYRIGTLCALLSVLAAGLLCLYLQRSQQALAEKLIRLHVVANSDTEADQQQKLLVRDAVLSAAEKLMQDAEDPKEALKAGLDDMARAAEKTLRASGCTDAVRVRLGKEVFPTRDYETFSLPAGVYTSLRVELGEGRGHNWWCVIFPSLCMTASMDDLRAAAVSAGFTQGEVSLITEAGGGYVLRFKLLELLQKMKNFLF